MKTSPRLKILASAVFVIFILMWSCKKNIATSTSPASPKGPNQSPPVEYVMAAVSGRVIDNNEQPVSGVAISTAFASTITDINGQFVLTNTQLDKNAGYIMAKKAGYFNGSKTFQLTAGSSNYLEIQLITKNPSGQFSASSGGIITINNGGSINFSANSIIDSSTGVAYSGTVIVSAYYLNPSASNFADIMPGELLGVASDSTEQRLQSYGMMVVELTGSGGQILQIAPGKNAAIIIPIPASLLASAPPKIPLWYFDEIKGLWREQDSAELQGNNYQGNVSHFSYWSEELIFPSIAMQIIIENKQNTPLSDAKILIKNDDDNSIFYAEGYTGVNGLAIGRVPSNAHLLIGVYDHCGDLVDTQSFRTSGVDINLGIINANVVSNAVTFLGTMTDCSGDAISTGIINVFLDGLYTSTQINNGIFSVTINRCSSTASTAQITAIDLSTNLQDTLSLKNVTIASFDSLKLSTCNFPDQYVYYTINGTTDTMTLANSSYYLLFQQSSFRGVSYYQETVVSNGPNNFFAIVFEDTTAINLVQSNVTINLTNYDSASNKLNTLTLTEFGSVGTGYIAGSFSGQVINNGLVPIQGRFRVKRTN